MPTNLWSAAASIPVSLVRRRCKTEVMGPLPTLIYYASVSEMSAHILAEYNDGDEELSRIAYKCLQLLPPHHSRFSHTTNGRMFACIISEPFFFCTIADEALSRPQVMFFLEQVRHEFLACMHARGLLADYSRLEVKSLDMLIDPIFRRLVGSFVGIPQKEKEQMAEEAESQMYTDAEADVEAGMSRTYGFAEASAYDNYNHSSPSYDKSEGSRSPSMPLIGKTNSKKYKQKKHRDVGDGLENGEDNRGKAHRMEITRDINGSNPHVQRLGSSKSFRGQQTAQRLWCKCVKVVLLLDAIICLILFGIWLAICKGFSCLKEGNRS